MTTNNLWPNLPNNVQDRMIAAYMDFAGDEGCDRPQAMHDLSTMDEATLREHLDNGIGYTIEDEHDRPVDVRFMEFMREYEHANDASFQDTAHTLHLCQELILQEMSRLNGKKGDGMSPHYEARLKMCHARLAEILLQRGDEDIFEGDGWLTRTIDVWIRG